MDSQALPPSEIIALGAEGSALTTDAVGVSVESVRSSSGWAGPAGRYQCKCRRFENAQ